MRKIIVCPRENKQGFMAYFEDKKNIGGFGDTKDNAIKSLFQLYNLSYNIVQYEVEEMEMSFAETLDKSKNKV